MDESGGLQYQGHSNWTIRSPFSQYCTSNDLNVDLLFWGPFVFPELNVTEGGVSVRGAFKFDHLQPVKPILLLEFFICCTFILGGHFLLPQRANNEKGVIFQFQKWMTQGVVSAWGIQTGPFAPH